MTNKKEDLPAMPFYIGDWKKDPAVSILSRENKMKSLGHSGILLSTINSQIIYAYQEVNH